MLTYQMVNGQASAIIVPAQWWCCSWNQVVSAAVRRFFELIMASLEQCSTPLLVDDEFVDYISLHILGITSLSNRGIPKTPTSISRNERGIWNAASLYPLVNIQLWKTTIFLMVKSTISMDHVQWQTSVYQRLVAEIFEDSSGRMCFWPRVFQRIKSINYEIRWMVAKSCTSW